MQYPAIERGFFGSVDLYETFRSWSQSSDCLVSLMSVTAEISGQNSFCSALKTTVKMQRDTRVKLKGRVSVSQIMVYLETID